jgi:hypothetical protein
MPKISDSLARLVGTWTTEATHPAMPGVVVHGTAVKADADESQLRMHYFDSRGVFRVFDTSLEKSEWRWWRNAPGFSQRFTGMISADDNTITGRSQLCQDDTHWADDLQITYRRRTP